MVNNYKRRTHSMVRSNIRSLMGKGINVAGRMSRSTCKGWKRTMTWREGRMKPTGLIWRMTLLTRIKSYSFLAWNSFFSFKPGGNLAVAVVVVVKLRMKHWRNDLSTLMLKLHLSINCSLSNSRKSYLRNSWSKTSQRKLWNSQNKKH